MSLFWPVILNFFVSSDSILYLSNCVYEHIAAMISPTPLCNNNLLYFTCNISKFKRYNEYLAIVGLIKKKHKQILLSELFVI